MFGHNFGSTSKTYGGGKNIWHEVKAQYPVGGKMVLTGFNVGDVIPAGSMCIYDQSAKTVTVVKANASAETLAKVNGLLYNDRYVDAAAKATDGCITATVVYAGEIYADRLAEKIPASVLAQLPMIVAIREA